MVTRDQGNNFDSLGTALVVTPIDATATAISGAPSGAVGDFDMEINYRFDASFDLPPPVASAIAAGFHLGDNVFNSPLTAATFGPHRTARAPAFPARW